MKKFKLSALVLIALVAVQFLTGCGSSKTDITTDDPETAFNIAKKKYDKRDYVDAIDDFSFIKIRFPGTDVSTRRNTFWLHMNLKAS